GFSTSFIYRVHRAGPFDNSVRLSISTETRSPGGLFFCSLHECCRNRPLPGLLTRQTVPSPGRRLWISQSDACQRADRASTAPWLRLEPPTAFWVLGMHHRKNFRAEDS